MLREWVYTSRIINGTYGQFHTKISKSAIVCNPNHLRRAPTGGWLYVRFVGGRAYTFDERRISAISSSEVYPEYNASCVTCFEVVERCVVEQDSS